VDLYILTLSLDESAGVKLRSWLRTILEESAVARTSSREIVLAAAEAVNNAVRHAAPVGTTVTVTMSIVGNDVYLRVTDREKVAAKPLEDADRESEPALASSLGLTLMQGLMDEVALHETDEGTTVRLVKRLRLPAEGAPPRTDADPPVLLESRQAV
jgi:anti-sigma regulatory factor (Ser/Thr protein kinase)